MARLPDPASLARPWVASYPPGVPPTYQLPAVPLTRLLDDAARDFPDHPAIVAAGRTTTYAAFRDHVDAIAAGLSESGITTGDRVLVDVPASGAPAVLFALWRVGAVVVPIDPTAARLSAVARDADAAGLVGTRPTRRALEEAGDLPRLVIDTEGDLFRRRLSLRSLLRRTPVRTMPATPAPDAPAMLRYDPQSPDLRGVVLTHNNLLAHAFQCRLWVPDIQAGRERFLVAEPIHGGLPLGLGLLTGVLAAATLVLLDQPDAAAVARTIDRERPTLWPTRPDVLERVAGVGRRDLTSLRVVITGSGLAPDLAVAAERRTGGARVRVGYGVAEAPLTHAQPVYGRVEPGSIGLPVTDTLAVVVDPDDPSRPCPPGVPGRLLVQGPQAAATYWRRHDPPTRLREGWVMTGDLATVDEHGVFTLLGPADTGLAQIPEGR